MPSPTIIYTHTDEAPALATYSFLPILRVFADAADIGVETRDISLAGRIVCKFPERMTEAQWVGDHLSELGDLAKTPEANIIKLPNISASIPQLMAAITELQSQGHDLPDYPDNPTDDAEREIRARYDAVKGSAVNPVLREGNSDRRAPGAVKAYAKAHPHRMGAWSSDSASHVSSMSGDDFFGNEKSVTIETATEVSIEHVSSDGTVTVLRPPVAVEDGEVVDSTFMSRKSLIEFLETQIDDARDRGILFSLHMKATMMKVSDPIIFGHAVRAYFKPVFEKHAATLERLGVDSNNGFGDVVAKIASLPEAERVGIETDLAEVYAAGPAIAQVDSDRGITNLHVPSDVIIDASMPAMLRESGRMWNAAGETQDAKAVIPDRSYAGVYQAVIDDCRTHGAYDPATMGSVPNVGLMARKAEEYGSHDKTFEMPAAGTMRVTDAAGNVLMSHDVETGDIWRMCQTKNDSIRDWVKLAVNRARATGVPAVFWLDSGRAHDQQLIRKVERYLAEHDTTDLEFHTMAPADACRFSVDRIRRGEDTISVTGNVLRDYLTDLFPILEVGTSAKMLSIVPLMNGGGLFETGAGGSAPKHVQQFEKENHLRWDSLGEFLALAASFEQLAERTGNQRSRLLGRTLDEATTRYLMEDRSPSRKSGELDNRGTHFYLCMYWAQSLAGQSEDPGLAERFAPLAASLEEHEATIVDELNRVQGVPMDIGGYYHPDPTLAAKAMRPSSTFNAIMDGITAGA